MDTYLGPCLYSIHTSHANSTWDWDFTTSLKITYLLQKSSKKYQLFSYLNLIQGSSSLIYPFGFPKKKKVPISDNFFLVI